MELTEEQIDKLAEGTPEDAAKVLTEPEIDKSSDKDKPEKEKQLSALEEAKALPFNAKDFGEFAYKRFLERLPSFTENSVNQVREALAYGADEIVLGTLGAKNYHEAVKRQFVDAGFEVKDRDEGTDKSALVVTIYK